MSVLAKVTLCTINMYTYVSDVGACLRSTIWNISYEYYLAIRIMQLNLISVLTLGIGLCQCLPVGVCYLPLCLVPQDSIHN